MSARASQTSFLAFLAGLTTIRDDEGQADGRDEEQGS
jgi:hypothetical protein